MAPDDLKDYSDKNESFFDEVEKSNPQILTNKGVLRPKPWGKIIVFIFLITVAIVGMLISKRFFYKVASDSVSKTMNKHPNLLNKANNANTSSEHQVKVVQAPVFIEEPYSGFEDPNIEKDMQTLSDLGTRFKKSYGMISFDGKTLLSALKDDDIITSIAARLNAFTFLRTSINRKDSEALQLRSRFLQIVSEVSSSVSFFKVYISKMSESDLNTFIAQEPELNDYQYSIKERMKYRLHILSPDTESYISQKGSSMNSWVDMYNLFIARSRINIGDRQNLNLPEALDLSLSPDRKTRISAGKSIAEFFNQNADIFASIYRPIIRNDVTDAKIKKYNSPISIRNLENSLDDDTVNNLINSVKGHYHDTSYRYYTIKAKLMGLDKLHYTDRIASLPFVKDKFYSWDEAKSIVLSSYGNFSKRMEAIARTFFDDGRIDAKIKPYKDSGAYCFISAPSVKPYIVMNFAGKEIDVFTLAHELGHGIHATLSNIQNPTNYNTTIATAELASLFGERLLLDWMMKNNTDILTKVRLLAFGIERELSSVVRQIAFVDFERKIHAMSQTQDVTSKDLSDIWLETQRESLGDIFAIDDSFGGIWAHVMHFFHSPFYVYSYAFADLLVDKLYDIYRSGSVEDFNIKYVNILSEGGSKNYVDLLKAFDVNPLEPQFWNEGMQSIIAMIDEFDVLVNSQEFKDAINADNDQKD